VPSLEGLVAGAGDPLAPAALPGAASTCSWCLDAVLVWFRANRPKEAITIMHATIDATPTNLTIA
jgi:hypothetical protein